MTTHTTETAISRRTVTCNRLPVTDWRFFSKLYHSTANSLPHRHPNLNLFMNFLLIEFNCIINCIINYIKILVIAVAQTTVSRSHTAITVQQTTVTSLSLPFNLFIYFIYLRNLGIPLGIHLGIRLCEIEEGANLLILKNKNSDQQCVCILFSLLPFSFGCQLRW